MHNHVIALYGNVAIEKVYCNDCECQTFVRKNVKACCGGLKEDIPTRFIRVIEPPFMRKIPTKSERDEILKRQGGCCLYCEQRFGHTFVRNGKPVTLRLCWDHKLPYAYAADNRTSNFCAACRVCNGIKSSHMFQTVMEAQVYIAGIRKTKGYNF